MLLLLAFSAPAVLAAEQKLPFVYEEISDGRLEITKWTGNTSLTLDIPSDIDGKTVVGIGVQAFENCRSFSSLNLPDTLEYIGHYAFRGCTRLRTLTVPEGVKSIKTGAFYGCTGLYSVKLPDSLTQLGEEAFYNTYWFNDKRNGPVYADKVFYTYKGGISQDIGMEIAPETVCIADRAFGNCAKLTSVKLPETLKSIGFLAFSGCEALDEIVFPSGLESIGSYAFMSCTGIKDIYLPASLESIGDFVFAGCSRLERIAVEPESMFFTDVDGVLYTKDMKSLVCIPADYKEVFFTVPDVTEKLFPGACLSAKLTDIEVAQTVTDIGEYAFGFTVGRGDNMFTVSEGFSVHCTKDSAAYGFCAENNIVCVPDAVYTDASTGIKIIAPIGSVPETTSLKVEKIKKGKLYSAAKKAALLRSDISIYDLNLTDAGKEVVPSDTVTVHIPLPEGVSAGSCSLYRISEGGANQVLVKTQYINGGLSFTSRVPGSYVLYCENFSADTGGTGNIGIVAASLIIAAALAAPVVLVTLKKKKESAD
ncbi:MAG: leucine-rich repeat protein [Clostridiales bacterium]|nr:leucine-rich repeat protein [Clostridiales bacterium]